ncbi:MAG: type II/IV secretion system protein [Lentisphaerae bacterium]|nr:type II/IV secretion system protein [Lentisphaerota bacterium]
MAQTAAVSALAPVDQKLAERLLAKQLLAPDILEKAIAVGAETGERLVEVLVNLDFLPKRVAYEEQAELWGVPFVDLEAYSYNPTVLALIDETMARELQVFPLFSIGDSLTVAMADPTDLTITDRLANELPKYTIEPCLAAARDIHEMINRVYSGQEEIKELIGQMSDESGAVTTEAKASESALQSSKSPVSRLVDMILSQAVRDRASDIHIDPAAGHLKVRFRIDGVLYDIPPPPHYLHPFIISRVKVISNMNIAESRIPQDGHFQLTVDTRTIEARVSSMPTVYGENMAIRLFDARAMMIPIEHMGLPQTMLPQVESLLRRQHGMLVLTGPTGSGKTTSLYAMLSKARAPERNIITIEDPVERRLDMVTQIQVNEKAGLTFASALRRILRRVPDVSMVGEIRDRETARLAVRAALTGHLLFSTIHTNDAPAAVTRLLNMNVEAFLIASSMAGAIAQRLVRCICEDCKAPYVAGEPLRKRLQKAGVKLPAQLWRGEGCSKCRDTGYKGRIGVFELMPMTSALAELVAGAAPLSLLREQARKDGMLPMLGDALEKAGRGVTTLEEALRVSVLESDLDMSSAPVALPAQPPPLETSVPAVPVSAESAVLDLDSYKHQMTNWLAQR